MAADTRDTLSADARWAAFCATVVDRIESIREVDGFDGAVQGWEMIPPRPRVTLDPLTLPQRCWDCGVDKPLRQFYVDASVSTGRNRRCAECCRAAVRRAYYARKQLRAAS